MAQSTTKAAPAIRNAGRPIEASRRCGATRQQKVTNGRGKPIRSEPTGRTLLKSDRTLADQEKVPKLRPTHAPFPSRARCWQIDPSDRAALATMRAQIRAALHGERSFDAELIATELLANAIRHGRGPIKVTFEPEGLDSAWLSVQDAGGGFELGQVAAPSPFPSRGLGLRLVRALGSDLHVAHEGDGCEVSVRVPLKQTFRRTE